METVTIQKATIKGQITLPVSWRGRFNTNQFLVRMFDNKLEILPADIEKLSEYTVFDAIRDNNSKPVEAADMLKVLKKMNG